MSSLIHDLQTKAIDSNTNLSDLLRLALLISRNLRLSEFEAWIRGELFGYENTEFLPDYRKLRGSVVADNHPYGFVPVTFKNDKTSEILSSRPLIVPIGEIQSLVEQAERGGSIQMDIPASIHKALNLKRERLLFESPISQLSGALDVVRSKVLDWAIQLEGEGILGEGTSFSEKDVTAAQNITFNIHTVESLQSNVGDVSGDQIQIGSSHGIISDIENSGVHESEISEIKQILSDLNSEKPSDKKTLVTKGMAWIGRNYDKIGGLAIKLTGILTNSPPPT